MNRDIKFPEYLKPLKFPGYFWHTLEKQLYSIKISGELKPLKLSKGYGNPWRGEYYPPSYQISHRGRRYYLYPDNMDKYLAKTPYTVGYYDNSRDV